MMQQPDAAEVRDTLDRFEGWLFKWANFFNGYQKRWFVLSGGLLSYFLTKEDVDVACRGQIVISAVNIVQEDSLHFTIITANGVNYYLRADSAVNFQRWIKALHLANSISLIDRMEGSDLAAVSSIRSAVAATTHSSCNGSVGTRSVDFLKLELQQKVIRLQKAKAALVELDAKLDNLETFNSLTSKHGSELCAALNEFENSSKELTAVSQQQGTNCGIEKLRAAIVTAQVFQESCSTMVTACSEFLEMAKAQTEKLKNIMTNDENRPKTDSKFSDENECSEDEEDFLDASDISFTEQAFPQTMNNNDTIHLKSITSHEETTYRTQIPFKPNYKLNLWAAIKNFIGRDLSKLPVPVNFNEPISMLQKLAEHMEYSELLEKAAMCKDSCEQMKYVMAFSVSSYSTAAYRTGKPFNPMLGETFESDRSADRGYKLITEQVGHHPPRGAMYAYSTRGDVHGGWSYWIDVLPVSSFRGNYLTLRPVGQLHIKFHATGNHYTWSNGTFVVNNIILGKLWIDLTGESNFINHSTGDKGTLTFHPFSYFSNFAFRKVSGTITDKNGVQRYSLFGTWDKSLSCRELSPWSKNGQKDVILWKVTPLHPLADKMYDFTYFAMTLNEWVDGTAPTDSRRRPDQRKMEEAEWDDANVLKMELEERQRHRRKLREADDAKRKKQDLPIIPYQPCWFKQSRCEISGENTYQYTHEYWEAKKNQDWSRSVNIFDLSGESHSASSGLNWPELVKSHKL